MNLEELKSRHPDVFAAVVAKGVEQERDRVASFFDLADEAPTNAGLRLAFKAIENGDKFTPAYVKHYRRAARAAHEIELRNEDDDVVLDAITGACPPPRMGAEERQVYNELVKLVGGGDARDVNIEDLEQG